MVRHYLVIWQVGLYESSRTETALDVDIGVCDNAIVRLGKIKEALSRVVGGFPHKRILGIYVL